MTNEQWNSLVEIVNGKEPAEPVVGFIIDSPWLPGWNDISIMDYFADGRTWFDANMKAIDQFEDVMFLPGFWSEYGMCTEPSAFGSKCVWPENEFPNAAKVINDSGDIDKMTKPNPKTDGLCPFVIKRLQHFEPEIKAKGHSIKFAVSRGPLNLASFLMGMTEFLIMMKTEPEKAHKLLGIITDFMVDWIGLQAESFESIDGVLILDDIVGFLGEDDFKEFAMPYLKRSFDAIDVTVKFFHNDAEGIVCTPYLSEIGINLFNPSFKHTVSELRELSAGKVAILGNIPPRDVLAKGTVADVQASVKELVGDIGGKGGIVYSCGGGMPPEAPTENIEAFYQAVKSLG